MLEPEIGLVAGGKLNFDQLKFNVITKKYMWRVTLKEHSQFDWKYRMLENASLINSQFFAKIIPTFILTLACLSEKDKIL